MRRAAFLSSLCHGLCLQIPYEVHLWMCHRAAGQYAGRAQVDFHMAICRHALEMKRSHFPKMPSNVIIRLIFPCIFSLPLIYRVVYSFWLFSCIEFCSSFLDTWNTCYKVPISGLTVLLYCPFEIEYSVRFFWFLPTSRKGRESKRSISSCSQWVCVKRISGHVRFGVLSRLE